MKRLQGAAAQRAATLFGISLEEAETAEYLGDSVYATFDGCHVWLRTCNGISCDNAIALDPHVRLTLADYVSTL